MNEAIKLNDIDDVQDIGYRPFNTLALIALLVSLLTIFALFNLVFLLFAALAVLLSARALYVGRGRQGLAMAGNSLAKTAILIAVFFVAVVVTKRQLYRAYLGSHAVQYANEIVRVFYQEEFGALYGYVTEPQQRLPAGTDMDAFFSRTTANPGEQYPPSLILFMYHLTPPLPDLKKDNLQGRTVCLGARRFGRNSLQDEIVGVDYRYTPANSALPVIEFRVNLARLKLPPPWNVQWKLDEIEVLKGAERKLQFIGPDGVVGEGG